MEGFSEVRVAKLESQENPMQVFGLPGHIVQTPGARWRQAMAQGLTSEQATKAVGVPCATLYRWRVPLEPMRPQGLAAANTTTASRRRLCRSNAQMAACIRRQPSCPDSIDCAAPAEDHPLRQAAVTGLRSLNDEQPAGDAARAAHLPRRRPAERHPSPGFAQKARLRGR
jgi:hypothetical protein